MDYKATIRLPKTDFPMRADLPKREPEMLERWNQGDLYGQIRAARAGAPKFVFHDGPPFANGNAHLGHALNRTLKDIIVKYKTMDGKDVPFVPGWDCHGLPIEHKVMKELRDASKKISHVAKAPTEFATSISEGLGEGSTKLSPGLNKKMANVLPDKPGQLKELLEADFEPVVVRQECEAYARKFVDIQRAQVRRLGIFADWENPYLTLNPGYEAEELRLFATLVEKGLVYEGLRPVHWSTGCQTALAEAEIEYETKVDPAAFVQFPLTEEGKAKLGLPAGKPAALLIWTTTPWTLPANLAVAASPALSYAAYEAEGTILIAATALAAKLPRFTGAETVVKAFERGTDLEGVTYRHPFLDRTSQVYTGDFVTADAGTGLVHIAPGHGMDDYQLGQAKGLPVLAPVDDRGCLTAEAGVPELTGVYVFKANPLILDIVRGKGLLWETHDYPHDYPHCWRSKTPIVFRAVKQWFIKMDAFRAQALAAIDEVAWVPQWGINRIKGAVSSRADWCISRQRTWGVPIPVFYGGERGDVAILDAQVVRKFADLVEKRGTNAWFETPADDLAKELGLPAGLRKGLDTLDVWIDSGSSHAAVLKRRGEFPADLYLEGSDQHRGWFQSSLLLSVATSGVPPFRQVLTHGFIVDGEGKKLSKSTGARDLIEYVNESGADILRLWVASQDYRGDVPYSKEIYTRVGDTYRTIRNTLRILLGNLDGFTPADAVADEKLTEVDRYILLRLDEVVRGCRAAYDAFEFHQVYHLLNRFCAVDLSAFYVDVLKDRMYCDAPEWEGRRSSQTAMRRVLEAVLKLLAPLAPFTAEEAWGHLGHSESIHLQLLPEANGPGADPAFAARWEKLLALRAAANEQLEKARQAKTIGKSLEAALAVSTPDAGAGDLELLKTILIVSKIDLSAGGTTVEVRRAEGAKCVRCWKYESTVGADPAHPELCERCARAVAAFVPA